MGGGPQVPQKSTQSKKNPKFKSEEVFAELKVFLKRLGFKMGAGFDYSTIALNTEKTFAVLNSVAEGKRQEIIDAFTKHNLFNCLELKEGKKSIRVDLVFFKNPLPASDKKDVKAPVKSTVKKSPVAKESPKGNNEDKLAELRAFIHASGIICGQHYANLTINAAKTVASINGVQAHGGALRAELIGEFNKEGLLECLDTTSTEKSIKVNLGLFKNPLIAKTEANKSQVKKVVKKVTEDKPPKKNEGLLAFTEPLNKLEKMVAKMDSLTKAMQFDPKTVWNLIKLHFAKNDDFELLVRTKIDGGEVSKVIPKEEFLKVLLK